MRVSALEKALCENHTSTIHPCPINNEMIRCIVKDILLIVQPGRFKVLRPRALCALGRVKKIADRLILLALNESK